MENYSQTITIPLPPAVNTLTRAHSTPYSTYRDTLAYTQQVSIATRTALNLDKPSHPPCDQIGVPVVFFQNTNNGKPVKWF